MARRILLVEDDDGLRRTLTDRLAAEGYSVTAARDGEEGLERAMAQKHDLVVLDVMLPKLSGFDLLHRLRSQGHEAPVLVLSARGQLGDKVAGLKLGADDYMAKPFEFPELLARVEARLRRGAPPAKQATVERYSFGDVSVDFRKAEATRKGAPIGLAAMEFRLLRYFVEHRGETVSRNELLDAVWGYNAMPSTRTVDVHVAGLRKKVEPVPQIPQFLLTVHGLGYKFVG